uniref:UDP-glycosyltransferase 1 n=1 Tax=Linum usitatissimum TaxID=4006 RepID=I2BH72_LINUS|nr:UDP-glycosyltransferase 1 [Linum usitatissimum]
MGSDEQYYPRHLVLVPCPYQGHINPMLQLATILHSRGFSISILHAQFNAPSPRNHPHFRFISIPDSLPDELVSSGNIPAILLAVNANCRKPLKNLVSQMMRGEKSSSSHIACIVYDELMYCSEAVAKSLGLPSIMLRTNTVSTFIARDHVLKLIDQGRVPLQDSILDQPVPTHYPLRYKDLPTSIFKPVTNFIEIVNNLREVRSSSAVIWNTMNCLENSLLSQVKQQCKVPIFTVGPMHKFSPPISTSLLKEDYTCMPWLDSQAPKSVIYVSLGSLACISESELAEMSWGLANSNIPFLWVVRPGLVRGSTALPTGFKQAVGDRGRIVQWAPQKEVLAHYAIGGFWSHCGWNSTMESICEGVPLVCRPNFADQKVTARYVTHVWRVGLQLEGDELEREVVSGSLRRLMIGEEGDEIRRRAEEVRGKVEVETRRGGSSVKDLDELVNMIRSF